ncbi:hypothetical protein ACH5RR_018153 [Cinchona calisaya]|uniref:DOG1 domain-containing protein n=1 Tax=Cinchona calisaya TaxID=153742 RepID=A0ABD2ZKL6_9GENT
MKTNTEEKFSNFFEKWMSQLEEYVQLHLTLEKEKSHVEEGNYIALVNKLTQHHKDYYTAKWAGAHGDVLAFFTPVWLSPLENAYLWITGWKPSMIFRLVDSLWKNAKVVGAATLADLSEDQVIKIARLRGRIRMEEEKVEREMERQQVAMADRKMVELARLVSVIKNGEHPATGAASSTEIDGLVEMAIKGLLAGLENVMKMADCVRLKTLKGVMDVLSPKQSVNFLAASSMLLIQMRKWGKKIENRCINQIENQ